VGAGLFAAAVGDGVGLGHLAKVTNILFVCSQNKLRSPTAEQIFAGHPGIETDSAGTNNDAENPLTSELVRWADMIFVMEKTHRNKLQKRYRAALKDARVICLDIPDDYEFMDEALVQLLEAKVPRYLPI
jgi:predicted protein tyrosine phosphatase